MGRNREIQEIMFKMDLFFSGRRLTRPRAGRIGDFVQVEPDGTGGYELEKPEATWRTFSEVNLGSLDHVTCFAARYGDPMAAAGALPAVFSSRDWVPLHDLLRKAAAAYGTDPFTGENLPPMYPEENETRLATIRTLDAFGPFTVRSELGPNAYGLRVNSLADHLRQSARIMLGASTPMRRCDHCGFWMSADHKATRFCDAVCRNNAAKGRTPKVRIG